MGELHIMDQGEGDVWVCAEYDHGPFCRRCLPVNNVTMKALVAAAALREETRPTDAEVEAAAEAIAALVYPAWQAMTKTRRTENAKDGFYPDEAGWARAALEAAAALHPPREGAEAEHKLYRSMRAKLATAEAALATTIEQRDQAEHQAATTEAALAEAERKEQLWRAEWQQITDTAERLQAALAESRGELARANEKLAKVAALLLALHAKGNVMARAADAWRTLTEIGLVLGATVPQEAPHEST